MSAADAPERALIDAGGKLRDATPRLSALNERAGGRVGIPLAVPQLAALAALTQTLRVAVSRTVTIADGDTDAVLHVGVVPAAEGVTLTVSDWQARSPRPSWLVEQPGTTDVTPAASWRWSTDTGLRITALDLDPDDPAFTGTEAFTGQPLTRFVRLVEDDDGDLPVLAALASGSGFSGQRAVRHDDPGIEILLSGAPRSDADGRFAGFDGTAAHASPEGHAAESMPEIGADDFAQRLGTVLRGPLDRIIQRADSIAAQTEGPLRRDYADYAGDIASAGRHLLAMVDDLADLQAIERPGFAVPVEPIDLADVARRAAGLLSVRAADRGIRISAPDPTEALAARGDFHRTLQILVNLIGNAVRYSPDNAMVWVRSEDDGGQAIIVVADQGKGIAVDDHARIFDKFERVDPSEPGGSGLGLYISRRLARAMGGDITLDSAPGQGARFVLTLPSV